MATGEFLDPVGSIQTFAPVLRDIQRMPAMDPKTVFRSATPGVIGLLTEHLGPWEGRREMAFDIPGVAEGGRAVGRDERMLQGFDAIGHIVALRGFEVAGFSHTVHPSDFAYGLTAERARDLAAKPQINFNKMVAKDILMDVITSGDYSGSITDDFAWSTLDLAGNTASQQLITDDADQVANVFANSNQTFTHWPMRDGTQAAAGHDHLDDTGAVWSAANAKTQADNVLEHIGKNRAIALVGSTVGTAVQAAKKSDFGGINSIVPLVEQNPNLKGSDFAFAKPIGEYDGIEYHHMVDLPASGMLVFAAGSKPFHLNIGALAAPNMPEGKGAWIRDHAQNDELLGLSYGFRDYVSVGVQDPLAVAYTEHAN